MTEGKGPGRSAEVRFRRRGQVASGASNLEMNLGGVVGRSGHVFADVRPSSDIDMNTRVMGETSHNQPRQPLPSPRPSGPLKLHLSSIVSDSEIARVKQAKRLIFHTVGDTGGVNDPHQQLAVADRMEQDLALPEKTRPCFLLHLGDVVYFDGQADYYYQQFYYPYRHYNAPIFAIPGNHDADVPSGRKSQNSLSAFKRNFCARKPAKTPESKDSLRTSMTQPYVYFQLLTPFATFLNLYTNCPYCGYVDPTQKAWLAKAMREADTNKALIVALHHPVFSEDCEHGSNGAMLRIIDDAVGGNRHPDLILSGHIHNYQRFTRILPNKGEVPYIVAGCGGYYDLYPVGEYGFGQKVPSPVPKGLKRSHPDRTLVNYVDNYFGYVRITITASKIQGIFQPCRESARVMRYNISRRKLSISKPADIFILDLKTHRVKNLRINSRSRVQATDIM